MNDPAFRNFKRARKNRTRFHLEIGILKKEKTSEETLQLI